MAQENVGININVQGNAVESIGNVKKALKEANAELINAQSNFGDYSQEAIAAAKRVAELKDRISEARETADLFDPGKKFQALAGAVNAVAGGFTAVQGALGVIGVESEDLQKSLLKVQSALALSQGLSAVTDSAKDFQRLATIVKTNVVSAFSTLRGAIISTGIGILAVAIGLVIANFDKVKKVISNLFPGLAQLGNFFSNIIEKVTDFVGVTSDATRALDKLKKDGDETLKVNKKFMEEHGDQVDQYTKKKIEAKNRYAEAIKQDGANTAELGKRLNRELAAADAERAADAQKARDEEAKKRAEEAKKAKEARDKAAKDLEEENQRRKDLEVKFFFDRLKAIDALNAQRAKEKAEQDALDKELLEQGAKDAEDYANKEFELVQLSIKNDRLAKDAKAKIAKEEADAKIAALDATVSAITNLSMIAGKETVAGKALAIAASIINTYKGITNALGSAPPPFNFISAAAVGAAGFAAVRNIVSVKVPGSAGGGASVPTFNASAPIAPPQPQAQTTTLDNQTINAIGNQAVRAYVVENDVTSNQQRIAAIKQRARFG
jgi:chromosome segregation ATPase